MSNFTLPILAVLVGGIFAALIDSPLSDGSSSEYNTQTNETLSNTTDSKLNPNDVHRLNTSQNDLLPIVPERYIFDFDMHMRFNLKDFITCTQIENGYVKYDGSSSCVHLYNDAACSDERYLSSNAEYTLTSYFASNNVKVCNKARDVRMYIGIISIVVSVVIWMCKKCGVCRR